MRESRRRFLKSGGTAIGVAAGTPLLSLSPAASGSRGDTLQWLSQNEADTLECIAEALAPGAAEAGICHFIDSQLAAPAAKNQLMLQYLGVGHADHPAFYRTALVAIDALSRRRFDASPATLDSTQRQALLGMLATDDTPGWQGAPASFVFFVLRSDAVDVVYGTEAGCRRLDLPYMAHIAPETPW
ncbi:MAG: gluconate 2-dehydrogenase subunit 3 family protein [Chromatocurvus sp.]